MRILLSLAVFCALGVVPASARDAVINPLGWSSSFADTAYRDTVQYVYFVAVPETQEDQGYTGDTVFYPFAITDSGSCPFTIDLNDTSAHGHGITSVLYHDVNGNGTYQAGTDTVITNRTFPQLQADSTRTLLVGVVIPDDPAIPDSTVDTVVVICASNTDPAWKDTLRAYTTIRVSGAEKALAFLDPDTTVVDSATVFTYRIVPLDGSADEFKIINPFGDSSVTVVGIAVNATALATGNGAGRPAAVDSARWAYDAADDTLTVLLAAGRVQPQDTMTITFTERMGTVPVALDSFVSFFSSADTAGLVPCSTVTVAAPGQEWNITVVPGIVDSYRIVPDTYEQTAGVAFVCTLTAYDEFGNVATSYDAAGTGFTWSGPAASPAPDNTAPAYPSNNAVIDSLLSASSGGSRGAAVLPVVLYRYEAVTMIVTDTARSIAASAALYVRHNDYDSLSVTPAAWTMTADDTAFFTANGFDAWKNQWDASDSTAVIAWGATGTQTSAAGGSYEADTVGSHRIWAAHTAYLTVTDTAAIVVTHGVTAALDVSPAAQTVTADDSVIMTATASDEDGNEWVVDDSAATIWTYPGSYSSSVNGVYQADTVGTWYVTAAYEGQSDTCIVTVNHGAEDTLDIRPDVLVMSTDTSHQFSATAYDVDRNGWDVRTSGAMTWSFSGPVSNTFSNGIFSPVFVGSYTVAAVYDDGGTPLYDTSLVTVIHGATDSISVTPPAASVDADDTVNVTVTAFDAERNPWDITDTSATTWIAPGSRDSVIGGEYRADTAGTWHVTAVYDGFRDTCIVTVAHGATDSLEVVPAGTTVTADGAAVMAVQAFDVDKNMWIVTGSAAWTHPGSRSTVAGGTYQADTVGTWNVAATYDGFRDTCAVTVTHGVIDLLTVTPGTGTITADDTLQLTATAADADGNRWDATDSAATAWTGTGTQSPVTEGVYRADTAGSVIAYAVNGAFSDTCLITVSHGTLTVVTVIPESSAITTDSTLALTATGYDEDGNGWTITANVDWVTDDASVTVTNGAYNPDSSGTYRVWAETTAFALLTDTAYVTVGYGAPVAVDIFPFRDSIIAGDTITYTVLANDADSVFWDVTAACLFSVTPSAGIDTNGADITGTVTGEHYRVRARFGALSDTASLKITPDDPASIEVYTPAVVETVQAGGNTSVFAHVFDQYGNPVSDTNRVTWSQFDWGGGNTGGVGSFGANPTATANGTTQVVFSPSTDAGDNFGVVATVGGLADTSAEIYVKTNTIAYVVILNAAGAPFGDTVITTDNDVMSFRVMGYDGSDNVLGLQNGTWSMLGDSTGTLSPLVGNSTVLTADRPGTCRIEVVAFGTYRDTTGVVIVNVGQLANLVITPDETTVTADDSVVFGVAGFDADLNPTSVLGDLIWSGAGAIGSIDTNVLTATTVGTDTVRVASSIGGVTDATRRIRVLHGATDSLAVVPVADTLTTDTSVVLTLTAYDADRNSWDVTDTGATVWTAPGSRDTITAGVYLADTVGSWAVSAAYDGLFDTTRLVVRHGRTYAFEVLPATAAVTADQSVLLSATAADADGNTWVVTDTSATVWTAPGSRDAVAAGLYQADYVGTWPVRALYDGFRDTCLVTITRGAAAWLELTPPADTIDADGSVQITATAFDADTNSWNVTGDAGTNWSATGASAAPDSGRYAADTAGSHFIAAVYAGVTDTSFIEVDHGAIVSLDVTPDTDSTTADSIVQFAATAFDADSNSWDVTSGALWGTSEPGGAVPAGMYAPDVAGTHRVYAAYSGFADTSTIVVAHGSIDSIALTPAAAVRTTDQTLAFAAAAWDADRNQWTITDTAQGSIWFTDDPVGTVTNGLYTMDTVGTYRVWVVNGGLSDTSQVAVRHGAAVMLTVAPESAAVTADDTVLFTAVATDADGNEWDATDSATAVWTYEGPVTGTFPAGIFRPVGVGAYLVHAVYGGRTDSAYVTVGHGTAVRVSLAPPAAAVTADDSVAMILRAYDADNNMWVVTDSAAAAWSAPGSRSTVAGGIYYADSVGTWYVTGAYGGSSDTCIVRVRHGATVRLDVVPGSFALTTDDTLRLTATAFDADSNSWDVTDTAATAWSTTEPAKTVPAGVYEPDAVGSYAVTAVYDSLADTCLVTVSRGATDRVVISPAAAALTTDDTLALILTAYDADNNSWDVTPAATPTLWQTDDPVGTVVNALYTADTVGIWRVWGTYDGAADTCRVTVRHGAPVSVVMLPQAHTMVAGSTVTYTVTAYDNDNIAWDVSDSGTITVTPDSGITVSVPQVRGIYARSGYAVEAVYAGLADTAVLNITPASPDTVYFTYPSHAAVLESITAGDTTAITVDVRDRFGNPVADTARIAWTWFDPTGTNTGGGEWLSADTAVTSGGSASVGFSPSVTAGDRYRITAAVAGHPTVADTSTELFVISQSLERLVIRYAGTQTLVGDTVITTDNDSMAFQAFGYDALDNPLGAYPAAWSIAGSYIGYLTPAAGTLSVLTATTPDVGWITAEVFDTLSGRTIRAATGNITVTVGALVRVELNPVDTVITADDILDFAVTGFDADSNITSALGTIVWTGGAALGVLDAATGLLDARTVGTDTIVVTSSLGPADTSGSITVLRGTTDSLAITPAGTTVTAGDTVRFAATAYDADRNAWTVTDTAGWGTVDSIAVVSRGMLTHSAAEVLQVWAVYDGVADTVTVPVVHAAAESVVLAPRDTSVTADDTVFFAATAYDAFGNTWDVTDTATGSAWRLTGTAGGILTGGTYDAVGTGTDTVSVAYAGVADTTAVVVAHGRLRAVTLLPATVALPADSTVFFSLTANDADGNTWDVTLDDSTVWSIDDTSGILDSARYEPVQTGVYEVVAANRGAADTATVTVLFGSVVRLDLTADSAVVSTDTATQFTVLVYDNDGNVRNYTDSCTWTSSDTVSSVAGGTYDPAVTSGAVPWYVAAAYGSFSDTVFVTVVPGAAASFAVEVTGSGLALGDTVVEAGDTLFLTAAAYDAEGNFIGNPDVDWTVYGSPDPVVPAAGPQTVFAPVTAAAACSIGIDSAGLGDVTGRITVLHNAVPDHYRIRFADYTPAEKRPVACSLYVHDRFGNLMTGYTGTNNRINVTVRTEGGITPPGAFTYRNADGGSDIGDGFIGAGASFINGMKPLFITYSETGDSIEFTFTEQGSGVTGTSDLVVWKNPNIISNFYGYPSPFRGGGTDDFKVHYVLRDPSEVTIRVFTLEGMFVWEREISPGGEGGVPGENEIRWDGRNGRGRLVESGSYLLKIWVESDYGTAVEQEKIGVLNGGR